MDKDKKQSPAGWWCGDEKYRDQVSRILGREIPDSEMGNRQSFDEFTAEDVEDVRRVYAHSPILSGIYVFFRFWEWPRLSDVKSFCAEVGSGAVSLEKWLRHRAMRSGDGVVFYINE